MANSINLPIKQAGSIVTVPTAADLPPSAAEGDCRWIEDANQFYIYRDGAWASAGSLSGPLTGTSTDNAIVRWDGTNGALVQDSNVTISDAGSITLPSLQTVDGRDVSVDGAALDAHVAASTGVHGVTGAVVGTTDTQTLTGKTIDADANTVTNIDNADIKTGANIDAAKLGTGAVSTTEFNYLDGVTSAIQTQLNAKQATSEKGAANGYASLDAGAKVPISQLPNSIMEFQGVWNAATNTPILIDGVGNVGDVYRVNTAGTQDLGSGSQTFVVGDWVMYDAAGVWQLAHAGADAVLSVNGAAGIVTVNAINQLTGHVTAGPASGSASAAATIASNVITDSMISATANIDASKLGTGAVSNTEFNYLDGVTSAIQTQLGNKQPLDGDLTAIAGLASTGLIARTAADTMATRTVTGTASRVVVTDGDGVSGNPTLDIGTDVVTLAGSQTLTNKTLTSPAISTPTGLVSSDVGLGNVDNTSDATKNAAAVALTNKDIDGGTAANNRRITLPANTTTNLNALTRKAGTVVYDTDVQAVKFDNGTTLATLGGSSVATPTVTGTVTSYVPVVQSSVLATSSNYTVTTTDGYDTLLVTTGASNITITLPAVASNAGRRLAIKKIDSGVGTVTVTPNGGTIEGASSNVIRVQYSSIEIISDGINWYALQSGLPSIAHEVKVVGGVGFGSIDTGVRRFSTTIPINTGTAITYSESVGPGSYFTINETGIYAISYIDGTTAARYMGITVNAAGGDLTTDVSGVAEAKRVICLYHAGGASGSCAITRKFVAGDIIRPQPGTAGTQDTASFLVQFHIVQLAKL